MQPLPEEISLILARLRARATLRKAWLEHLWVEEGQHREGRNITAPEVQTHLEGRDDPGAEAAWLAGPEHEPARARLAAVEAALRGAASRPLAALGARLGLSEPEQDLVQLTVSVALDPALNRVLGYLNDHSGRAYVTDQVTSRLYGHGLRPIWAEDRPVCRWGLVSAREAAAGAPAQLVADPSLVAWTLGEVLLPAELSGVATAVRVDVALPEPLEAWPVTELARIVRSALRVPSPSSREPPPRPLRICLQGPPDAGRRTMAGLIAQRVKRGWLVVDADRVPAERWSAAVALAWRHAHMTGDIVVWTGRAALERPMPWLSPPPPVQIFIAEEGQRPAPEPDSLDEIVVVGGPTFEERRKLWRVAVPKPIDACGRLAARFRLGAGDLARLAGWAPMTELEAGSRARAVGRDHLGGLAELMESQFTLADLELPADLRAELSALITEARARAAFWEEPGPARLFPQGRGLLALFSGPSGTGKTMAASVLANELGLDLFRVDLAAVVSKYVGETSQNLDRILRRAARMDAVLLFDEADALFGKRTEVKDAHDRFANTDTGYLLQAIETYPGVALLTSNRLGNIDTAFLRRLRYQLSFPRPDAAARGRLWDSSLKALAPTLDPAARARFASRLGDLLDLTGAQIKLSALSAVFLARGRGEAVTAEDLLRGVQRELSKEGRSLSPRERAGVVERG